MDLKEIPEEFNDIANYLGTVVQDDDFRNQLKGEDEIDEIFRNQEAELAITKQREAEERRLKEEERRLKEEERRLKEEALQQKKAMQIQFAKHLLQQNTPVSEISKMTGLDEKTISEL